MCAGNHTGRIRSERKANKDYKGLGCGRQFASELVKNIVFALRITP